jgi:hypothetical protein
MTHSPAPDTGSWWDQRYPQALGHETLGGTGHERQRR